MGERKIILSCFYQSCSLQRLIFPKASGTCAGVPVGDLIMPPTAMGTPSGPFLPNDDDIHRPASSCDSRLPNFVGSRLTTRQRACMIHFSQRVCVGGAIVKKGVIVPQDPDQAVDSDIDKGLLHVQDVSMGTTGITLIYISMSRWFFHYIT